MKWLLHLVLQFLEFGLDNTLKREFPFNMILSFLRKYTKSGNHSSSGSSKRAHKSGAKRSRTYSNDEEEPEYLHRGGSDDENTPVRRHRKYSNDEEDYDDEDYDDEDDAPKPNNYFKSIQKYASCKGRSQRNEFWTFNMVNLLIMFILVLFDIFIELPFFSLIFGLIIFIPTFTVTVRRLHDTGKSGWLLLLNLVPGLGQLILFIFFCMDSDRGSNKWGADPKRNEK